MKKLIFITVALLSLSQIFAAAADDNASGVDRYAVYIGSNKGGKGREELLYAGSDAQNFKKAMSEIGGVTEDNSYVLIDPSISHAKLITARVTQNVLNLFSIIQDILMKMHCCLEIFLMIILLLKQQLQKFQVIFTL